MERRGSAGYRPLPATRHAVAGAALTAVNDAVTISACAHAILSYYGVEADDLPRGAAAGDADGLDIREVAVRAGHVTMKMLLPMPYGDRRMTVTTAGPASIVLPGMALSPAIAAAAIGRPVGRLTGHPAFDGLDDLVVTGIAETRDADGATATVLSFVDFAEALRPHRAPAVRCLVQ